MSSCGIVLAGGNSVRMGTSKADLDWHGTTLLQRTVDVLGTACTDVFVVAAPGQTVVVRGAEVVRDAVYDRGPLQALSAGLAAAREREAGTAFVCATDMPLLHPAFVRHMIAARVPEVDVALAVLQGHEQPLAAAYASSLVRVVNQLLARDELRLRAVFDHCRVRRLSRSELLADTALVAADPHLDSLVNVNTMEELAWARGRTGQAAL